MKYALLTGGGDCPGMNAFIRAAVRCACNLDPEAEVIGIIDGWRGLIEGTFRSLERGDVAGIIHQGGTILGTMRAPEFRDNLALQRRAAQHLIDQGIDYLIMQGGNGSLMASVAVEAQLAELGGKTRILAASGSIDNDVANNLGFSIGFHSAVEKSVEMLQWIRDTADSHRRIFIINSMGAKSAYLAFYAGIASGAEYVIRPNEEVDFEALADLIVARSRDTRIIVSEAYPKSISEIRDILAEALKRRNLVRKINTVDMGYFQRGGTADITDVLLTSWTAFRMVKDAMAGTPNGYYTARYAGDDSQAVPLAVAADGAQSSHSDLPPALIEMAQALR